MRLLRLFVILVTLVSLPGYGLAATGHVRDCPEQAPNGGVHVMASDMDMSDVGMEGAAMPHDCCAGTGGQHSQGRHSPGKGSSCAACVAGHGCKTTHGVQLPGAVVLTMIPLHAGVVDEPALPASLCGPDGLLRPPRFP